MKHLAPFLAAITLSGAAHAASTFIYVAGENGAFGAFDLATREYQQISSNAFANTHLMGLAYDSSTETLYYNARRGAGELHTINLLSGSSISALPYDNNGAAGDMIGLASNNAGLLYTYNYGNDAIFSVNPATAVGTQIAGGGSGLTSGSALTGKLAFLGSTLYGAMSLQTPSSNGLYSFNTSTGAYTFIGNGGQTAIYTDLIIFSSGSTLYGLNGTTLYQVDPSNGNLSSLGALSGENLPASFRGAAIPEPSTSLLGAAGAIGLLLARRRQRGAGRQG